MRFSEGVGSGEVGAFFIVRFRVFLRRVLDISESVFFSILATKFTFVERSRSSSAYAYSTGFTLLFRKVSAMSIWRVRNSRCFISSDLEVLLVSTRFVSVRFITW